MFAREWCTGCAAGEEAAGCVLRSTDDGDVAAVEEYGVELRHLLTLRRNLTAHRTHTTHTTIKTHTAHTTSAMRSHPISCITSVRSV